MRPYLGPPRNDPHQVDGWMLFIMLHRYGILGGIQNAEM